MINASLDFSALPERLREKIFVEPNTGCWLWMGQLNPDGYGIANVEKNSPLRAAHRIVWELANGREALLRIHHHCHTRCCVNPLHLEEVTDTQHGVRHRKLVCKNGHDLTKSNARLDNGKGCRICHYACQKRSDEKHAKRHQAYHQEYNRQYSLKKKLLRLSSPGQLNLF